MQKYIVILILFWLLPNCRQADVDRSGDSRKKIAFFGSSVCRGSGDEEKLGYAGRFGQRLDTAKWTYVNVSKGGDNTFKIIPRLDSFLYPQHPDYVVIGLSLSNEGIKTPNTEEGQQRILERFRTGLLRLADSVRSIGAVPVFANCYVRNSFNESHYRLHCRMNEIISEWPFPSINLMGTVNNGQGGWVPGLEYNDGHPNGKGYEEMSRAIVPTLFDALEAGKKCPERNGTSDYIQFCEMNPTAPVLWVETDTLIHAFAESFMFRAVGDGLIGTVRHQDGISTISVKNGYLIYNGSKGSVSVSMPSDSPKNWVYFTLSHNYAKKETCLYINGKSSEPVEEQLKPVCFSLGGSAGNTSGMPDSLSLRDWMIHRSSLTPFEVRNYMAWKMLASSLESYAPLCEADLSGKKVENRAQSLTDIHLDPLATCKVFKLGYRKDL